MLMVDEAEAVRQQRGMHSTKEPRASTVAGALNDVSTDGTSDFRMNGNARIVMWNVIVLPWSCHLR